jgi:hypothetical protein
METNRGTVGSADLNVDSEVNVLDSRKTVTSYLRAESQALRYERLTEMEGDG